MTEEDGDRLLSRLLGRDLQAATMRLALYGLIASVLAATVLAIVT